MIHSLRILTTRKQQTIIRKTWNNLNIAITFLMLNMILNDELTSPMVLGENEHWTSNHASSRNNSKQRHLITPCLVTTNHATSKKCRFDIKMTAVSGALNNLLETAATPQQRPGDASVTNIPEHSTDELLRLFTTSIAPDSQKLSKYQQAWNLITPAEYIRQCRQSLLSDTQLNKTT